MSIYFVVGILALIAGYTNLKIGPNINTSRVSVYSILSILFSTAALFGIIYAFISFGIKDGLLSVVLFFLGGAIGAVFGR